MFNNQDFALLRAKSLGGSDIGAILGFSKYRSAVDVWMEKTGKKINNVDSLPVRFGQYAEEFVAQEYQLATGKLLINHPHGIVHPTYPYMHGHIDRFVQDTNTPLFNETGKLSASRILECKTANPFAQSDWGDSGSDQVPMPYLVQCIWYMMLTEINRTDLAVLFGNADFRIYEIHRDLELEEIILNKAIDFWQNHVQRDLPPPAKSEIDLKQLFNQSDPKKIVEAGSETCELIKKLHQLNIEIERSESEISNIKQIIMTHMQDAEVMTYQGQTLATWKSPKPSYRLDAKKLAIDHPELSNQYQIAIQNSRRLNIKELL